MLTIEQSTGDNEIVLACGSKHCSWTFTLKRTPYDDSNVQDLVEQHGHWHNVMGRP